MRERHYMACYKPNQAWKSLFLKPNGKHEIVFNSGVKSMPGYETFAVPCGRCVGCKLDYSAQWATRCIHEAQMHLESCFITLTFSDAGLIKRYENYGTHPNDLALGDFQRFMKAIRHQFAKQLFEITGNGIRFYHAGEYGGKYGRPHYHALLFNYDFPDKTLLKYSNGTPLYISDTLKKLWPYGHSSIGTVTFQSAAYVARYILKKVNGKSAQPHYEYVDTQTGELIDLKSEYTTMSRNPGIGKTWYELFKSEVYPNDSIQIPGKKYAMKPPRFYDNLYEIECPDDYKTLKAGRVLKALKRAADNTPERLYDREQCKIAHIRSLNRPLDMESFIYD